MGTTTDAGTGRDPYLRRVPTNEGETSVPKFLIERVVPGAGSLGADELRAISAKSNRVLAGMAPRAQWVQSYVTPDKLYCIYIADDLEAVHEHARGGGFPADVVSPVVTVIDPTTGE
jgi:hypothetical protein